MSPVMAESSPPFAICRMGSSNRRLAAKSPAWKNLSVPNCLIAVRSPFCPPGMALYEFIRPFFDEIDHVGEAIRGGSAHQLRVAVPAIVLHDYLPEILRRVRNHFPAFRLTLHEAARPEAERLLQAAEIDLAGTVMEHKKASEI